MQLFELHLLWETDLYTYLFLIKCVTRSLNNFLISILHIYECNFN